MKKNKIIIIAVITSIILACFLYMNGYTRGQWYIIDSNGEHVSGIGYNDCEGGLVIDNKELIVLSRKNMFNKKTIFIVDNKGKTIMKGNMEITY